MFEGALKNETNRGIRVVVKDLRSITLEEFGQVLSSAANSEDLYFNSSMKSIKRNRQTGRPRAVLSTISPEAKYSGRYRDCIGLVLVGIDKEKGVPISLITHSQPVKVLSNVGAFKKTLSTNVEKFFNMANTGSVEAVLFGGKALDDKSLALHRRLRGKTFFHDYKDTVKAHTEVVQSVAGIPIEVHNVHGPQDRYGEVCAYLNTPEKILTLLSK